MCLSCGCKQPNDDHGDDRNITLRDVEMAAGAAEISAQEAVRNIQAGFDDALGVRQGTGNNQQRYEDRQGGYSGGGSPS